MPLPILLALVIGGIAGIAALLHLSGQSRRLRLSAEGARAAWARHFPDDLITAVTLTADGHAAMVSTDQGAGLIWAFGADSVARHLRDFDLIDTAAGLKVTFHDFTAPAATLRLSTAERRSWRHRLAPA